MSEDKMEKVIGVAEEAVVDAPVEEGEESFAELLEQSIKTLYTGQKVSGVVTGITPTEIYVDLDRSAPIFSDEYDEIADSMEDPLTEALESCGSARYDEIMDEANEKLAEAEEKLADANIQTYLNEMQSLGYTERQAVERINEKFERGEMK